MAPLASALGAVGGPVGDPAFAAVGGPVGGPPVLVVSC